MAEFSFRLSAHLRATKEVLAEVKPWYQLWAIWIITCLEVWSMLMLVQISALTNVVWLGGALLAVQGLVAACHRHCQTLKETGQFTASTACRASKVASLFMFFPWKYSAFGLYRRQSSASCFYTFAYLVRFACIIVLVEAVVDRPDVGSSSSSAQCLELLKKLEAEKPPSDQTLIDEAKMRLTYLLSCQMPIVVATASLFQWLPICAFLASVVCKVVTEMRTFLSRCECCSVKGDRNLQAQIKDRAKVIRASMAAGRLEPSWKDRKLLDAELALLLLDVVSDLNCIVQFAMASRWGWAAAQTVVFLLSMAFELKASTPASMAAALLETRKCGYPTDEYLIFVRTEKTIEAPFSLLLQYYSTFYVFDPLLFLSACVSMLLSSLSVAKGAYEQLHLALDAAVDHAEELADQESRLRDLPPIQVEPIGRGRQDLDRE